MLVDPSKDAADQLPSYRRLLSKGGVVFSFRVGGAAITYLTQVALARWIGSEELGIYVEAFAWALIISILTGLGLSPGAMKFGSNYLGNRKFGDMRGYVAFSRLLTLIFSIAVSAIAAWVIIDLQLVADGPQQLALLLALACVPFLALMRLDGRISHVMSWFHFAFFPNAVLRPGLFLAVLSAAFYLRVLDSAIVAMAIHFAVILVVTIGMMALVTRDLNKSIPKEKHVYHARSWLMTSLPLILVTLFTFYFAEINIVLSGVFVSPSEVGIFNAAFRTALLIGFGIMAIDAINLPSILAAFTRGDTLQMQRTLQHAARLKGAASLAGVLVFLALGRQILGVFGTEFIAGYVPLIILASSQVVRAVIGPVSEILAFCGQQNRCLVVYGVGFVATIVLQAALLPSFGIIGGAIAAALIFVFVDLWMLGIVVQTIGINPSIFGATGVQSNTSR